MKYSCEKTITPDTQQQLITVLNELGMQGAPSPAESSADKVHITRGLKQITGRVGEVGMSANVYTYPNGDHFDPTVRNCVYIERADEPGLFRHYQTRATGPTNEVTDIETWAAYEEDYIVPITGEPEVEDLGWQTFSAYLEAQNEKYEEGKAIRAAQKDRCVPSELESQQLLELMRSGLSQFQANAS